ncbi:MAG: ribonuclease H-like domain-containing protein [Deltaproteobacteria bacterium]|nr:ribonuclease H-like domain-containing protein [Deltaproteobacteria bacterium]
MLEETFVHIQKIGLKTEKRLWDSGIHTWGHFLNHSQTIFSPARDAYIRAELESSIAHLTDIRYFSERLHSSEMWRIFETFKEKAVYLDIETSGLYHGFDEITVIGLFDGYTVQSFVNGRNLEDFEIAIASYDLVITFNGTRFDFPFIRRWFKHISLPPAHIDLCFFLRKLGYKGGLKSIEKQVGLAREEEVEGLGGFEAVLLWQAYQQGDQDALDRLVRYNTADIVNLEPLMKMGFEKMKSRLTGWNAARPNDGG